MARVVRPGGEVAAYVWDVMGGKGTAAPIQSEMLAMGLTPRASQASKPHGSKHFSNCGQTQVSMR